MTKIYIAARVIARHRLKETREQIRDLGYQVLSTWLDVAKDYNDPNDTRERIMSEAIRDLNETDEADIFIIDTLDESPTGGREVELGEFICRQRVERKLVESTGVHLQNPLEFYLVGPWRNLFHLHADRAFSDWDQCIQYLKDKAANNGGAA